MQTEAPLTGEAYDAAALANPLRDAARGAAAAAGAVVLECGAADASDLTQACAALAAQGLGLSHGAVRRDSVGPLTDLAAQRPDLRVLATAAVARQGPLGRYDPNTGQIADMAASTVLTAALIEPGPQRSAWSNDAMLRSIPGGTDDAYRAMLSLLFTAAPSPTP